jgi:hypothetical protein
MTGRAPLPRGALARSWGGSPSAQSAKRLQYVLQRTGAPKNSNHNEPTAKHVLAVHGILPRGLRLPLLTLDATGVRVGELADALQDG